MCNTCGCKGAEEFAEEIEVRRRKRCKDCGAENVGTEEVDYCYTCGEMGEWGDSESPESCPECGRNSVGTEDVDYCYTCGSFGLWYETLGYYEGEELASEFTGMKRDSKRDYARRGMKRHYERMGMIPSPIGLAAYRRKIEVPKGFKYAQIGFLALVFGAFTVSEMRKRE